VSQPQKFERMGQELTNYFAVVMDFPNPDASLREGMTGTAKIAGKSYQLASQAGRGVLAKICKHQQPQGWELLLTGNGT